jgi:hypothetical protein
MGAPAGAQTISKRIGERVAEHDAAVPTDWTAPIPPFVEGDPVASKTGDFCFSGGHPVTLDDLEATGPGWHDQVGPHKHDYAPLDLRVFRYDGRCYHFSADPVDFGHEGRRWHYHGPHQVSAVHGGGWCYMPDDHTHAFGASSPFVQKVGRRLFWSGPYDSDFAAYYPYFTHFYRTMYGSYYGGGRYLDPRTRSLAPPLGDVPLPPEMMAMGEEPSARVPEEVADEPRARTSAPSLQPYYPYGPGYGGGIYQTWGGTYGLYGGWPRNRTRPARPLPPPAMAAPAPPVPAPAPAPAREPIPGPTARRNFVSPPASATMPAPTPPQGTPPPPPDVAAPGGAAAPGGIAPGRSMFRGGARGAIR